MSNKICIVADDQEEMRSLIVLIFEKLGFVVRVAHDGPSLLATLQNSKVTGEKVQLIVTDLCMPGCTGFEALEWAQTFAPEAPVILITAFGTAQTHRQALRFGAARVIDKPFSLPAFKQAVNETLASASMKEP